MAEYQITYWRNIPAMVTARVSRRQRYKVQLSTRFQTAIDEAAMRAGATGSNVYREQWRRSEWQRRAGTHAEVANTVAAELGKTYSAERIRKILGESDAGEQEQNHGRE